MRCSKADAILGRNCAVLILVRKPLAMPVVPAVVPPLSSFRNGSSRPATGARRTGCAIREGRELWTRIAYRTRAGIARATWRGYRGVAGRVPCGETEGGVGGTPGMPAGQAGGAGMVEGGARPDHTRTCLRIAPKHSAGNVVGRSRGKSAIIPRERHHERGALTGRDRTTWARGHHAGTVGPGESVTGRHVRRQSDGSRTG